MKLRIWLLMILAPLFTVKAIAEVDLSKEVDRILSLRVSNEAKIDSAYQFLNVNIEDGEGFKQWESLITDQMIPYMKDKDASDLTFAKLYYQLGVVQGAQGERQNEDVMKSYRIAEDFARKSSNLYWLGRIIEIQGTREINKGNPEKGYELQEKAIEAYRGAGEDSDDRISGCFYAEAVVFFNLGDTEGIKGVIERMKNHARHVKTEYRYRAYYNLYAVQSVYFGSLIKATDNAREKRALLDSLDKVGQSAIYLIDNTPDIWNNPQALPVWDFYNRAVRFVEYEDKPVVDSVEHYLTRMLEIDFRGLQDTQMEAEVSAASLRAEMWMKLGNYDRAKQAILAAIGKADSMKINNIIIDKIELYNNLLIIAKQARNYKEATEYAEKIGELEKERYSDERAKAVKELEIKYKTKETELSLAQSKARLNSTLMWLFAALALLAIIIAIFRIYVIRQHRVRLQQYIAGLESERARMSRELHDGVCNDLLAIQMTMTNPENLALIESCRESVRRISHELMPPEFEYATLDEAVRYFIGKQPQNGITVTYSSEVFGNNWINLPEHTALEVYRIVQEAVGNAIKHSGGDKVNVNMTLKREDLIVKIIDNGHCAPSGKHGMGVDSIRRRAEALGAKIDISMSESDGTKVCLHVKV